MSGTVEQVLLSARVLRLREPVDGVSAVALTGDTALTTAAGGKATVADIRPGTPIRASGNRGESDAFIATQVVILQPPDLASPPAKPTTTARLTLPSDLYFIAQADGVMALWARLANGPPPRLVVKESAGIMNFSLVPRSDRIVYRVSHEPTVYLIEKDGSGRQPATMPDGRRVTAYVGSPDGRLLAYVPADGHSVWVSDTTGSNLRQLYQVKDPAVEYVHSLSWSPDGHRLLFQLGRIVDASRPVVVAVESAAVLWTGARPVLSIAWSPDGTRLVYSNYAGLFRVDLDGGQEIETTPPELRTNQQQLLADLAWLPGDRVAFTQHADGTVYSPAWLWIMQVDGSAAHKVRELGPVFDLGWPPAGDHFVVARTPSQASTDRDAAGLFYYSSVEADPMNLAPGIDSLRFGPVEWESAQ